MATPITVNYSTTQGMEARPSHTFRADEESKMSDSEFWDSVFETALGVARVSHDCYTFTMIQGKFVEHFSCFGKKIG